MSHWPDLERCKRLKEAGYPQKVKFYWVTGPGEPEWVEYWVLASEYGVEIIAAAPIVTELVEEIRKLIPQRDEDERDCSSLVAHFFQGNACSVGVPGGCSRETIHIHANTLPNTLADLWMELKGENHDT